MASVGNAMRRVALDRRDTAWLPERGATAIEYAVIASVISIAAVVGMGLIGGEVSDFFNMVVNAFP